MSFLVGVEDEAVRLQYDVSHKSMRISSLISSV